MKPAATILMSLFFSLQFGGCVHTRAADCVSASTRSDCVKAAGDANVIKEANAGKEPSATEEPRAANEPNAEKEPSALKGPSEQSNRPPMRHRRVPPPVGIERPQQAPPAIIRREQVVPQAPEPLRPTAPMATDACDSGGCWDNNANRYNGPPGNTVLDNRGRPCHRTGTWVQCF